MVGPPSAAAEAGPPMCGRAASASAAGLSLFLETRRLGAGVRCRARPAPPSRGRPKVCCRRPQGSPVVITQAPLREGRYPGPAAPRRPLHPGVGEPDGKGENAMEQLPRGSPGVPRVRKLAVPKSRPKKLGGCAGLHCPTPKLKQQPFPGTSVQIETSARGREGFWGGGGWGARGGGGYWSRTPQCGGRPRREAGRKEGTSCVVGK